MHKIEILIPPISAPETRAVRSALLQPEVQEFDIATRAESGYDYERKICLTDGGAVLQVMSKDANGDITVALPQDAYDLSDPIRVLLMDVNGDGTDYRLRIQLGGLTSTPPSQVTMPSGANRQLHIAEFTHILTAGQTDTLGFIGSDDLRAGFVGNFLLPAGVEFQVSFEVNTNNLIFLY